MCWLTASRIVIDLVLRVQQIKLNLESFCCNTAWDLPPYSCITSCQTAFTRIPGLLLQYAPCWGVSQGLCGGVRTCHSNSLSSFQIGEIDVVFFTRCSASYNLQTQIRPLYNSAFKPQFCEEHTHTHTHFCTLPTLLISLKIWLINGWEPQSTYLWRSHQEFTLKRRKTQILDLQQWSVDV